MDLQNALQRALRHLTSGSPADCLRLCDEILADTPGLIEAMYLRGCAAYETGDIDRSISDLDVVRINHPQHLHAAYYLGRSLRAAGKSEDALEPLEAALKEQELEIRARYELALWVKFVTPLSTLVMVLMAVPSGSTCIAWRPWPS